LEDNLKELTEKYDENFLDISHLDMAGQLAVIEFYEYLLAKQNKKPGNSPSC